MERSRNGGRINRGDGAYNFSNDRLACYDQGLSLHNVRVVKEIRQNIRYIISLMSIK